MKDIQEAARKAAELKQRIAALKDDGLALLFREARTHNAWQDRQAPDELLQHLFELMVMGPTSANCLPARFVFLKSKEAKERLRPHLFSGNVDKTMAAPVAVIVAYDLEFYVHMARNFPFAPEMGKDFEGNAQLAQEYAMRNGSLQGGYFIMAARALGLDCGPMSGFSNEGVDKEFFSGTQVKSNFLCNIGWGDARGVYPRSPRFGFEEVCTIY